MKVGCWNHAGFYEAEDEVSFIACCEIEGETYGSRRWTTSCEQAKRSIGAEAKPWASAAMSDSTARELHCMMAVVSNQTKLEAQNQQQVKQKSLRRRDE